MREKNMEQPENASFLWKHAILLLLFLKQNERYPHLRAPLSPRLEVVCHHGVQPLPRRSSERWDILSLRTLRQGVAVGRPSASWPQAA